MKQISCMLLSFVLLCGLCVPAFALGTAEASGKITISAEVPSSHKVTVQTDGGAAVIYGEDTVKEFDAPRFGTPTIFIRAQNGQQIKSVLLNGTEISDKLQGGKYTFSPICEEQALVVITENEAHMGNLRTFTINGTLTENGKPLSGVTLELRSELKTCVTGKNGKFHFEKAEAGHHSLTAVKDGSIVGYMEFLLSASGNVDFTLSNGIYSVIVPDDTATINLALVLGDNGSLDITDVTAQKASKEPGDLPQTGDNNHTTWWLVLFLVSGFSVVITLAYKRKHTVRIKPE